MIAWMIMTSFLVSSSSPCIFAGSRLYAVEVGKLDQVELPGGSAGFDAVVDVKLAVDALHLSAHSVDRDDEFARNVRVGIAGSKQAQNLALPRTQRLQQERRTGRHLRVRRGARRGKRAQDLPHIGE